MGRSGRDALVKHLPSLKEKLLPDVIIVNVDNAVHGRGVSKKVCSEIYDLGVDCLTGGDHVWDQREILTYINNDPRLLRPMNYPDNAPGNGHLVHTLQDGRSILILHALARTFMPPVENPFTVLSNIVRDHPLRQKVDAIFIDFHGEATSEKMAMAQYLDGKVSAVVGTHTHIPTADAQIFPKGTAFQTDAGMVGDYDSIIGVKKEAPIHNFTRQIPGDRMVPADGEATLCGTLIETDDKTGLAKNISPVRVGPRLQESLPSF